MSVESVLDDMLGATEAEQAFEQAFEAIVRRRAGRLCEAAEPHPVEACARHQAEARRQLRAVAGYSGGGGAPTAPSRSAASVARAPASSGGPRACRACGCTDEAACVGGCSWVEADLCSACSGRVLSDEED